MATPDSFPERLPAKARSRNIHRRCCRTRCGSFSQVRMKYQRVELRPVLWHDCFGQSVLVCSLATPFSNIPNGYGFFALPSVRLYSCCHLEALGVKAALRAESAYRFIGPTDHFDIQAAKNPPGSIRHNLGYDGPHFESRCLTHSIVRNGPMVIENALRGEVFSPRIGRWHVA